jgi:TRAP-type C4-dicarboxylate transport system substrate-binding protein
MIPAILDGRVEIAPVLAVFLSDVMLEMGVLELPFMTKSPEEHRKAAEQLRTFYTRMMARRGLKLLGISSWPELHLYSHQPVRTVEEWKGKKIRVFGSEHAELVRIMGGAPVLISFGEVYSALGKKLVDGAITSPSNAEPMKFFEVVKYINYWFLNGSSIEWLTANQKAWDALPRDLQQVVVDSLKEIQYEDKGWGENKSFEGRARKRVQELGMIVIDPTPDEIEKANKKSRPVWDIWLKRTGKEGGEALDIALKALGRTQ